MTLKPWATIARIASPRRATSAGVKCCAPLGPPSTTAQRGPGSEASRGVRGFPRRRDARRGERVRRGQRRDHVGAAKRIVFGRPDQVHFGTRMARILEKDREHAASVGALERPHIGHGDAPARYRDVGRRVWEDRTRGARLVLGIDGSVRRQPRVPRARLDPPQLIRRAERLDDAQRIDFVPDLARPQHQDAHAFAEQRVRHASIEGPFCRAESWRSSGRGWKPSYVPTRRWRCPRRDGRVPR